MSSAKGAVFNNKDFAGILEKTGDGEYIFRYDESYFKNSRKHSISLTLPKQQQEYRSKYLFPFFSSLLSDGINGIVECTNLHIDANDHFTRLLKTANTDTIGAITVKEI